MFSGFPAVLNFRLGSIDLAMCLDRKSWVPVSSASVTAITTGAALPIDMTVILIDRISFLGSASV